MSSSAIAKNFTIQSIGKALSVLVGLASIAIITRALGPESFGEYTTAITFVQLFAVVVDFGLTLTLVVMISESGSDESQVVGNFISLRFISGMILFSLAPLAVLGFDWSFTIKLGVVVGAVAFLFASSAGMLIGIFQKHKAMWRSALAELINRLVLILLIAVFAYLHYGVIAMIAAMIIANLVWWILMIKFATPFVRIRPKFEMVIWKKALSKSWPIAISIFFNLLYLKGDILFLAYFRDQSEVGLYGLAYRVLDVLTALPVMFMGLVLPNMVAAWSSNSTSKFQHYLNNTFDVFMIGIIPIIAGVFALSLPIIQFIAGPGYDESALVLNLLILAGVGVFLGALYGHTIIAINKQKLMVWGYILVAIVSIVGYLWLIPIMGMFGAAYVTIASEILITILTFGVVIKTTGIWPNLKITFKAILASLIMYFILITIPQWHIIIMIIIGVLVYFLIMLLISGIKLQTIKNLIPNSKV
ncbi:flippase [Patescibacteria group bacterium]